MAAPTFSQQIAEIKQRARERTQLGAVTAGYRADRQQVIAFLNEALATEIVCVLRYQRHYQMAEGIHGESIAKEFLEHAENERTHADSLATRIAQLGGEPNYDPQGLAERSHTEYVEGENLTEMIQEDLVAERIVIDIYSEAIRWLGNDDPTTRRLLEQILADEEEHADELAKMLVRIEPQARREDHRFAS